LKTLWPRRMDTRWRYKRLLPFYCMRRAVFLIAVVSIISSALALAPSSASITAFVDPSGVASVREDYLFIFHNSADRNEFLHIASIAGDSFQVWSSYIPQITYHIGSDFKKLRSLNLYWVDLGGSAARLVVSYTTPAAFVRRELPTATEFIMNNFRFPTSAGAMHVPPGYTITVYLPSNAKIIDYEPKLSGEVRNPIVWKGPLAVGSMYVIYTIPKPAAAPSLVSFLSGTPYSVYVVGFLVVLAVLLFIRWDHIKRAIEKYVSENTHFEE